MNANILSTAEANRFASLKQVVHSGLKTVWEVGAALTQIRDEKLYRMNFDSFEEFCRSEFKIERAHAYRLIEASEVKMSPIGDKVKNEGQARAISSVKPQNRAEVLEKAAQTGKVTAKTITEAAKVIDAETVLKDNVGAGRVVPKEVVADWQRAVQLGHELRSLCTQIKAVLSEALESKDPVFAELATTSFAQMPVIADVDALRFSLNHIAPYAVCPVCQGRNRSTCQVCRKRGFVSKQLWNSPVIDERVRKMLEYKK